jgi:two-component system chemotaxis sensor kinase CheA
MVLAVSATGIGLTLKQEQIIFGRFVHGNSLVTRFLGGSGLCFALVEGIISCIGGKITLHSITGQASLLTCEIWFQNVILPYSAPIGGMAL